MKVEDLIIDVWDAPVSINEVFNTKIPVDSWKQLNPTTKHGYINIDGTQFVVIIEQSDYYGTPFMGVSFAKMVDGQPVQDLTFDNVSPSKIIGAVSNAIYDYASHSPNDFIVFMARDNVRKRMRVYNFLANKMVSKYNNVLANVKMPRGGEATILYTSNVAPETITKFKEYVSTLEK